MPTIDLSSPPPAPTSLLDGLPRRVTLTLPELRLVAERAGGAPLPFDLAAPRPTHGLEGRLGASRSTTQDAAFTAALATLHDPEESLRRRGLLGEVGGETGLVGAVGLLATPQTALDLDVTAAGVQARAWHRRAGDAVAALATVDGIVFELAWFHASRWAEELGRVGVLPEEVARSTSQVPDHVDLPFGLADAAGEAVRSGRLDLLPVLVEQADGAVLDVTGAALDRAQAITVLEALTTEARGRLRVLAADLTGADDDPGAIGVVSWTLLADGWHALRPRERADHDRVQVVAVEAADLATELAPVLAQVAA